MELQSHPLLSLTVQCHLLPHELHRCTNSIGKLLMFPEYPKILVSLMQSKAEYALGWCLALTFCKGEQGSEWF